MSRIACVVLPTYNEARNVATLIPQIFEQSAAVETHALHVLVVDDNSPDGTGQVVRDMMGRFPRLHLVTGAKQGLGAAYKRGIAHAIAELRPELIFQMDADGQHSPTLIPWFVTLANHGFSLVIGSRFVPGGATPDFSLRRRMMSHLGNWMIRFLGGLPRIHDCTSGYRCIRASILAECDFTQLSTRGYSFLSSLLCELLRNGAKPIEVPIVFGARRHGESKLALRDQLEFLVNIFRIRFRKSAEFIRLALAGTSVVIVNMVTYFDLTRGAGVRLELAAPVAIEVSLLWSFLCNSGWTLRHRNASPWPNRLARFHLVTLVGGMVNYVLLVLLATTVGIPDVLANLIGIAAGALVNYSAQATEDSFA
jgi:dolichol-phosphate mannosyltransferase